MITCFKDDPLSESTIFEDTLYRYLHSTMYEFRPKPSKNRVQNMIEFIMFDHPGLTSSTWKPQISWYIFWNHFGITEIVNFW